MPHVAVVHAAGLDVAVVLRIVAAGSGPYLHGIVVVPPRVLTACTCFAPAAFRQAAHLDVILRWWSTHASLVAVAFATMMYLIDAGSLSSRPR